MRGNLHLINEIIFPESDFLEKIQFTVACDVKNPLFGPNGAAFVYGPQKVQHLSKSKIR